MVEEVKFNNNSVNNTTVAQSTDTKSATVSTSSVKTNTIFDEFKKRAIKQGVELTLEDFQKFLNENPDLSLKTPEEQNALFNKFLAAGKTEEPQKETLTETTEQTYQSEVQTEQSKTTETIESAGQTETAKAKQTESSEQTQSANLFAKTKTEETETQTTTKTTNFLTAAKSNLKKTTEQGKNIDNKETFTQKNDGAGFDSVKFSKMEPDMKAKSYVYEYTKNKFLYSDSSNPKAPAEWNNLTREEQFKLVQACSKEIEEDYKRAFEARTGKKAEGISSDYIEIKMLELQAANDRNVTMEEFNNEPSVAQAAYVAEMLSLKEQMFPTNMSDIEKSSLKKANFILDACKDELKRQGKEVTAEGLCFDDIAGYAQGIGEIEFSMGTAIKNKLASIPENERTDEQKAMVEFLESVPDKYLNDFGLNLGQPTALDAEIRTDKDFAARYDAAQSPDQRAQIKVEYYKAKYADNPEQFKTFLGEAIKSGDFDEINALLKLTKDNEKLQEQLINSVGSVQAAIAAGVDNFSVTNIEKYTQKVAESEKKNPKRAGSILQQTFENLKKLRDKNKLNAAVNGAKQVKAPNNAVLVSDLAHQTFETYDDYNKFLDGASLEVTREVTSTAYKAPEAIQAAVADIGLKHKDENIRTQVSKIINQSGAVNKFAKSQQNRVFTSAKTVFENDLPKQEAIAELNKLSDQISNCDKDNQLAMHRTISNSKYSEVVEHAAANIYTYDRTVQSEAVKISYEVAAKTGNIKIIENIGRNYTKLDPEVQQVIANDKVMAKALSEITARAIGEDNELTALIRNESAAGLGLPKTEKEVFLEKWNEMSSAEKYQFMCEISTKYFNKMSPDMRKRVLEHAKNDPLLMRRLVKAYGLDLLKTQLFPDALGVIVRELLQDPAERMSVAREVCNQPSRYSESLVEKCQELLAEHNNVNMEAFNQLSGMEKREVLKNPSEYASAPFGGQMGANRSNLIDLEDPNEFKTQANLRSIHFLG